MPVTPLVNSCIDNVLIKISPELNQPLFQFMNAMDVCLVNTLRYGHLPLIVDWVEFLAVRRPHIQRNEVWHIYIVSRTQCAHELFC